MAAFITRKTKPEELWNYEEVWSSRIKDIQAQGVRNFLYRRDIL